MLANKPSYKTSNLQIEPGKISEPKNCLLLECFNSILTGNRVHLNMKKVMYIIGNELQISLNNISQSMKCILCECFCYYMKTWHGWKTYSLVCADAKAKENYQAEFKDYLTIKLNYVIENEKKFDSDCSMDAVQVYERMPQANCTNKIHKSEAPYTLVISGEPYFLNNIGFLESKNDIVIQPHIGRPWKCLNIRQFLNYPFIQVCIKLPDLELSRENSHLFTRYISNYEDIECPPTSFIDFVKRNNLEEKVNVYAVDFISTYCKQFIELIKNQYQISKCKILELEMIFKQFLWDVEESNIQQSLLSSGKMVNTMATNVTVCFNIGGHTYTRNKKMCVTGGKTKKEPVNVISFSEILIPKMMFTLNKFIPEQDNETNDISFKSLNEIVQKLNQNYQERLNFSEIIHNSVSYSCLLCSISYYGKEAYNEIVEHFSSFHRGEQTVVCSKCRKEFAIAHLAGSRWTHECKKQEENSTNSTSLNNNMPDKHSNIQAISQTNHIITHSIQREDSTEGDLTVREDVQNSDSSPLIRKISSITDKTTCLALNSTPIVALPANTLAVNTENGVTTDVICEMQEKFNTLV